MPEPEEIIEAHVVELIDAAGTGLEVFGALMPAPEGEAKAAPPSHINVAVDVASQDIDWKGPGVPCSYSVRVSVRVAFDDDKTGALFRDTCRAVRGALASLIGDGCAALDGDGFSCDAFTLPTTQTTLVAVGKGEDNLKTYAATTTGRFFPPQTQEDEQ